MKGRGDIETTASRSVLTNNGDITLWSNSDNSGGGSIVLGDNNVLNSSNGRSGDTDTGGGRITLGGGSGYGTSPTGYSSSSTGAGIKLGTSTSNHTEIYSGGGDISIKGSSTATGQVDDRDESGIYQWGRMTMKSGRGGITMQGTSGEYQGIGFTAPLTESDTGVKQLSMVSSKTSGTAIQLTGSSSAGVGVSFNYLNPKEVLSLGAGQVTINGTGVGTYGIEVQNLDVLSSSGDINMYGGTEGMNVKDRGVRFGSLLGSSVTSSSADLMVQGNELEYDDLVVGFVNTLESTGTAVMESQGSAFSSTFDYKNFDLGSSVSSLRIGKTSNSANVEVYDPVSIAGPISIYGGDVTLNDSLSNISSTISLHGSGSVIDGPNGYVVSDSLGLYDGMITLDNPNNNIGVIAGSNLDGLSYLDSDDLEIGTVNPSGITASGEISVSTMLGNLTVSNNVTSGSSSNSAIILNAGKSKSAGEKVGGDIILSGSPVISSGSDGRITFYSGQVNESTGLTNNIGLGSGRFRYSSDEINQNFTNPLGAGSYAIYRETPVATIESMSLVTTYQNAPPDLQFTGTVNADPDPTYYIHGRVDSSTGKINAGTYSINSDNLSALGYNVIGDGSGTLVVSPKRLDLSGLSVSEKVYDGTNTASLSGIPLISGYDGDVVALNGAISAVFPDKNVGENKAITISNYNLVGADASNYTLVGSLMLQSNILPRSLEVNGLLVTDKIYDGNTIASIDSSAVVFNGLIPGDDFTLVSTGSFDDKNVGVDKDVLLNNQFSGIDLGNYQILDQTKLLGKIVPKNLSLSGIEALDKTYDGSKQAILDFSSKILNGLVEGDDLNIDTSGAFLDKHVGTDKEVSISHSFSGADLENYNISAQSSDYASIRPRNLFISGIKALNKTYDGTTSAEIDISALVKKGLIPGDELEILTSANFLDKSASLDKTVVLSHSYSGSDLPNYIIEDQDSDIATIFRKPLRVSGLKPLNKVYDGNSLADIDASGLTKEGLVRGDEVIISSSGLFKNDFAESKKEVNITNLFSGIDVNNYIITDQVNGLASIFPKVLKLLGVTALDRDYDGTESVKVVTKNAKLEGLLADDEVKFVSSGKFLNKSAGNDKTVTLANRFSGSDLSNYDVTDQVTTTATIHRKVVFLSGEKIFDGKEDLDDNVQIITGVNGETLSYLEAVAASPSVAGPDGEVGSVDNFISSIKLMDATDGSGGVASNYILPELNSENAPVKISASTIVIEESINAQMFDISASGQEGFINNVEYGVSAESSVSIESTVLQTSGITSQQGTSSSSSGVNQTDNELGMKIEMVTPPNELSTGIVAVTIPQSTAVAGTGFSFGLPEEISSLVSSSQSEFTINLESGAPLPSWISYNQESGKFVSSAVPDGAFPLKVIMNVDGKKIAVVISERQE